jgi:polyisoprenoid-binding protein YceI
MTRSQVSAAVAGALLAGLGSITAAQAAGWVVDPAKSRLGFTGQQTGAPFAGRFKTWSASIDFDPAKPETAHVVAVVDVISATTDDPQKDEAMPSADWFDASSFAKATFAATGFAPKGGDTYETQGMLTLRGVTKPATLAFTLTIAGDQAHAVGKAKLVRTDFGVGQGSWSTGDMVGLDVDVDMDVTATRKP